MWGNIAKRKLSGTGRCEGQMRGEKKRFIGNVILGSFQKKIARGKKDGRMGMQWKIDQKHR